MTIDTLAILARIRKFNRERGYLEKGYDAKKESAYPIEEALEGFSDSNEITFAPINSFARVTPKEFSRNIMRKLMTEKNPSKIESVDKHLDILIYSFGSLMKLGLSDHEILNCLEIVMEANETKVKESDAEGKSLKGDNFIPPEKKLELFLKD
jgi:uncharacterized Rmd1/YagE family protein